jgi:hypothetical protein
MYTFAAGCRGGGRCAAAAASASAWARAAARMAAPRSAAALSKFGSSGLNVCARSTTTRCAARASARPAVGSARGVWRSAEPRPRPTCHSARLAPRASQAQESPRGAWQGTRLLHRLADPRESAADRAAQAFLLSPTAGNAPGKRKTSASCACRCASASVGESEARHVLRHGRARSRGGARGRRVRHVVAQKACDGACGGLEARI